MSDESSPPSVSSDSSESLNGDPEHELFINWDAGEGVAEDVGVLPKDALNAVLTALGREWFFAPRETEQCLQGALAVVQLDYRVTADDHGRCGCFLREAAPDLFRRCYTDECVCDWSHDELSSLLACSATLVRVTARLLEDALCPEHFDGLKQIVCCSIWALNQGSPFHQKTKDWRLPEELSTGAGDDSCGLVDGRQWTWLQYLVAQFIEAQGIETLCAALGKAQHLTKSLTERFLLLGSKVAPWMDDGPAQDLAKVDQGLTDIV